jgi:phosphoribosylaminoimidazole-succinocarboxamide synthase
MSNSNTPIKYDQNNPYYNGSVQRLYSVVDNPELLVSETSLGGSVFDVGTIFTIKGSDTTRAGFRHLVYQSLQDANEWSDLEEYLINNWGAGYFKNREIVKETLEELKTTGLKTHHRGMVNRADGKLYSNSFPPELSNLTLIKKYTIHKPDSVNFMTSHYYDYEKYYGNDKFVIPLEYIVRFGVTSGSSILRKYSKLSVSSKKAYLQDLDLKQDLIPWQTFDAPIIDLTTKYEPEDRNISRQEALLVSGIGGGMYSKSLVKAILASFIVHRIFNRMGLFLWDLKWEIAKDGDDLVFVDTLDTDSVRATLICEVDGGNYIVNFNKQAMRDYYIIVHDDWYAAVNGAKQQAKETGESFTQLLKQGQEQGTYPATPEVDPAFMSIQEDKYDIIKKFIVEKGSGDDYQQEVAEISRREVEYFLKSKNSDLYKKLNSVD